jgi:hypothetical protein
MRTAVKIGFSTLLLSLIFPSLARAEQMAPGEEIGRFVGTVKGSVKGTPALMLEVHLPPDSTQITKIRVPNQTPTGTYDPNRVVVQELQGVQPGDLLIIKTETFKGAAAVANIGHYAAKPGEDEPGSYLFVAANTDGEHPTVTLSRFGQIGVVPVATTKDQMGKNVPDPAVLDALKSFNKDDVVIAKLTPGRVPMLASIEIYTPPLKGEFVKITSTTVAGQPHPAIEIETATGTNATILLPGTTSAFGKFTPDPQLYSAVRRLHANAQIEYRTTQIQSGGQPVLKDINPAKPTPGRS